MGEGESDEKDAIDGKKGGSRKVGMREVKRYDGLLKNQIHLTSSLSLNYLDLVIIWHARLSREKYHRGGGGEVVQVQLESCVIIRLAGTPNSRFLLASLPVFAIYLVSRLIGQVS